MISASDCRGKTSKNIGKLAADAILKWPEMQTWVEWVPNSLTSHKPLLLTASKDKPVLISALATNGDVLMTLDRGDFGLRLRTTVYDMQVSKPRDFLMAAGLA